MQQITAFQNLTKWGPMSYVANDALYSDVLARGFINEESFIMETLHNTILRSSVILDIGAHAGSHSVIYSKLNPNAQIYAFEPQMIQFTILQHNISTLELSNITAMRVALGNKECDASMSDLLRDGPNLGSSAAHIVNTLQPGHLGGLQIGNGGESVIMKCLDSLVPLLSLDKISFIRIDVSGFEMFVLDGAYETLKKYRPAVLVKLDHKQIEPDMDNFYNAPKFDGVLDLFRELGYAVFQMKCNYIFAV